MTDAPEASGRRLEDGLLDGLACVYTRALCHSSLTFLATIWILHIKEIGEGELQKALV
jgi:hypothetical protein